VNSAIVFTRQRILKNNYCCPVKLFIAKEMVFNR